MAYLEEKQWIIFNEMVQEIYQSNDIQDLENKFLRLIRKLIPYKSAVFSKVNSDGTICKEESIDIGSDEIQMGIYNNKYAHMDYTNPILEYPKSTSYRDLDMIDESQKSNTEIYKEFLEPHGLNHSAGLVIKADDLPTFCITLFRNDLKGTFKDSEVFILEQCIGHLENILSALMKKSQRLTTAGTQYQQCEEYESLTSREQQILPLILTGFSNHDIAEAMFISESTAKKHIYHILEKFGVSNRGNLIKKISGQIE